MGQLPFQSVVNKIISSRRGSVFARDPGDARTTQLVQFDDAHERRASDGDCECRAINRVSIHCFVWGTEKIKDESQVCPN